MYVFMYHRHALGEILKSRTAHICFAAKLCHDHPCKRSIRWTNNCQTLIRKCQSCTCIW